MFTVFAELEFGCNQDDGYWTATAEFVMPCVPVSGWYLGHKAGARIQDVFWLGGYEFRVVCYSNDYDPADEVKEALFDTAINWEFTLQDVRSMK